MLACIMLLPFFTASSCEHLAELACITDFACYIIPGLRKNGAYICAMSLLKFRQYRKGRTLGAKGAQRHADDKSGNSMFHTFKGVKIDYAYFRR